MSSAELWIMFFKSGKNLTFFSAFLFSLCSLFLCMNGYCFSSICKHKHFFRPLLNWGICWKKRRKVVMEGKRVFLSLGLLRKIYKKTSWTFKAEEKWGENYSFVIKFCWSQNCRLWSTSSQVPCSVWMWESCCMLWVLRERCKKSCGVLLWNHPELWVSTERC